MIRKKKRTFFYWGAKSNQRGVSAAPLIALMGLLLCSQPLMAKATQFSQALVSTDASSIDLASKKKKKKKSKKKSKASKKSTGTSPKETAPADKDNAATPQEATPEPAGAKGEANASADTATSKSALPADGAGAPAGDTEKESPTAQGEVPSSDAPTAEPASAVLQTEAASARAMAPLADQADKLVAVLDFDAAPDLKDLAQALTTVATLELSVRSGYKSISRNDLQSILTHQAESQLLGCESVSCMADIAKLVDANLLVTGKLDQANDALIFSMTLIDPTGPTVLQRTEAVWRSDPKGMIALMNPQLDRLLNGDEANQFMGKVEVLAESGASILLNNVEKEPIIDEVTIGSHRLIVTKGGYVTHEQDIVVSRNETTIVRVELEPSPYYTQWWFWTLIGGTGVTTATLMTGAAVGTAALLMQEPDTTVTVGK